MLRRMLMAPAALLYVAVVLLDRHPRARVPALAVTIVAIVLGSLLVLRWGGV